MILPNLPTIRLQNNRYFNQLVTDQIKLILKIRLIYSIITSYSSNKLPIQERFVDDIREAELIGTFIDPILNPIFNDPEKNRLFRW